MSITTIVYFINQSKKLNFIVKFIKTSLIYCFIPFIRSFSKKSHCISNMISDFKPVAVFGSKLFNSHKQII